MNAIIINSVSLHHSIDPNALCSTHGLAKRQPDHFLKALCTILSTYYEDILKIASGNPKQKFYTRSFTPGPREDLTVAAPAHNSQPRSIR